MLIAAMTIGFVPVCTLAQEISSQAANATSQKSTITVGDVAPKLNVGNWIKGGDIGDYAKDQVYVVQFSATWCGPCKKALPGLRKLATQHAGKVTFAVIYIWEGGGAELKAAAEKAFAFPVKLEKPADGQNDPVISHVAVDDKPGSDGRMAKLATSLRIDGVPTSLIVNGEGKIAWIGNPNDLGEPLQRVLDRTWDIAAATTTWNAKAEKEEAALKAQLKERDESNSNQAKNGWPFNAPNVNGGAELQAAQAAYNRAKAAKDAEYRRVQSERRYANDVANSGVRVVVKPIDPSVTAAYEAALQRLERAQGRR